MANVYSMAARRRQAAEALVDVVDAETVQEIEEALAAPVDPPPVPTSWLTPPDRHPIVPLWLLNAQERRQQLRRAGEEARYVGAFHAVRVPLYGARVARYAPVGLVLGVARLIRWATAEEGNWGLRQHAASRGDAATWAQLNSVRARESRWRWWVVGALTLLVMAGVTAALTQPLPDWIRWTGVLVAVGASARAGRPQDKPITDRVTNGPTFTKLTAEMVRAALVAAAPDKIKDPGDIKFHDEIHKDGPGYLARLTLPAGLEAVTMIERRGRIASGLRLPVDQVWPAAGPGHAGQLDLWVGYQPASKMGQPRWSLTKPGARTSIFEPFEFGTDQRQRPVMATLFARNWLIGGVPGSGKSYAARALALGAALDPIVELMIVEYKGTADFGDLAALCSVYACGVDDEAFATGMNMLTWGLEEARRRGKRIADARARGEAPEGKVTPELARRPGSGLHPIVMVIDEAHELFGDATVGKDAAKAAERLIKRGRALGIIVILATQIPDKDSLPPIITRCVTMRWCLAVQDYYANDMILGTGAYKRGLSATHLRPDEDAGWGIVTGLKEPTSVRSHFPSPEVTAEMIAHATRLRGGQVIGAGAVVPPARDVLADVERILTAAGGAGMHWEPLARRLAEIDPAAYAGATGDSVSALVRGAGVESRDVRFDGAVRKGARCVDVADAIAKRGSRGA